MCKCLVLYQELIDLRLGNFVCLFVCFISFKFLIEGEQMGVAMTGGVITL